LEARIGKYFQVILPKDLHYSTRRNTICFFRCFNTCCHFRIGNFDDFPKFCRKYTWARYQLSHYILLCKAQANHIITQNKRDTQIWCGSTKPTPQNFTIKYWGLQPLIKHALKISKPKWQPRNHSQQNTTLILLAIALFLLLPPHTINIGGMHKLATTHAIYTSNKVLQ